VCVACVEVLPVAHAAVMLMAHPDDRHTLSASSESMTDIEELQYTLGEGPSVEAFTSGGPMIVPDISVPDARWPVFSTQPHPEDVRALFAFPLHQGGVNIGVLSLARDNPTTLTDSERGESLLTADAVALTMLTYLHDRDAAYGSMAIEAAAHMWDQMKVDEAIGMVMAQIRGSATMALARLRAAAFVRGQSLPEVANQVVNRTLRFDPEPPEPGREHRLW
jgi:GAF domain-containing protein